MKRITHVCMDRPMSDQDKSKEYVQPQYIVDCINNLFMLPTKPYQPGNVSVISLLSLQLIHCCFLESNLIKSILLLIQAAPAHLSPFVDNEAEGYLPDRQREINSLAGVESNIAGPSAAMADSSSDDEEEDKAAGSDDGKADKLALNKGDIDSSSDEEGTSEELSDSDDEKEVASKVKKGPGKKIKAAEQAKTPAKTSKKIKKQVMTKADKQAKNEKIKRDLKKEQQELGKMLMSNR